MRDNRRLLLPLALGAMLAASGPAIAGGDPAAGESLARVWCSGCHAVANAKTATDAAPSFQTIARQHGSDPSWLRSWLVAPHPPMPNFDLSRVEIDDIVAYLESLPRTPD